MFFKEQMADPVIRDCLLLSSQELLHEAIRKLDDPVCETGYSGYGLSFLRYYLRMASRCTPFGLFAGYSTGRIAGNNSLTIAESRERDVFVRFDMEYLVRYAHWLSEHPDIISKTRFRLNSSAYRMGSSWKFIEITFRQGYGKEYQVVEIDDPGILTDLAAFCREGKTRAEIIMAFSGHDWSADELKRYFSDLYKCQFLVSDFDVILTRIEFQDYLKDLLCEQYRFDDITRHLQDLLAMLPPKSHPGKLATWVPGVQNLVNQGGVGFKPNHLLQADTNLGPAGLTVTSELSNRVLLGIRMRRALSENVVDDRFAVFIKEYVERFGESVVPLVVALDPETGIGLDGKEGHYWTDPCDWVDDLVINAGRPAAGLPAIASEWIKPFMEWPVGPDQWYRIIQKADLKNLDLHGGTWPHQMHAMVELSRESGGQPGIHYVFTSNGHPARLIARFGFADPENTGGWIGMMTTEEQDQYPGKILAEIVHLPEDRTGNILQRPATYDYEITYLAGSELDPGQVLDISDLMLKVETDELVLFSARFNKRVMPRLTNAHHYARSPLPIYRFLSMLSETASGRAFNPQTGLSLQVEGFVPGVRYEELYLVTPVWSVASASLMTAISGTESDFSNRIMEWRVAYGLPRKVFWIQNDHELYIDWEHEAMIRAAWEVMKSYNLLKFRPFPFEYGSWFGDGEESYANQCIFAYHQQAQDK